MSGDCVGLDGDHLDTCDCVGLDGELVDTCLVTVGLDGEHVDTCDCMGLDSEHVDTCLICLCRFLLGSFVFVINVHFYATVSI